MIIFTGMMTFRSAYSWLLHRFPLEKMHLLRFASGAFSYLTDRLAICSIVIGYLD